METYSEVYGSHAPFIGVSGIVGAGKTTLVAALAGEMGWDPVYEPASTNPYLGLFYGDMKTYSFPMQMYLLGKRFRQHQSMVWSDRPTIQDRTIYEDVIFAKMLWEGKLISELDFQTYRDIFQSMTNFLHRPDLIIHLDVSPEVALERVKLRGRECESTMTLDYLRSLRAGYEDWLDNGLYGRIPVIRLLWDHPRQTSEIAGLIKTNMERNTYPCPIHL